MMPLAMRNLAIAKEWDRVQYKGVRGSGWDRPKPVFKVGDFVLVRGQTKGTLDIATASTSVTSDRGAGVRGPGVAKE